MSGAFQTSREIFSNPIWKNVVEFRLFFLIYGKAAFSDGVRIADDLILRRGEWCRSTRKLQEDLQYIENRQVKTYSTSVINRCIKKLERSQRIRTRSHELGTVFTVVNYEMYQGFGSKDTGDLERNLEQSGNGVGTVGEQSGNNNNNSKKSKKELKDLSAEIENFRSRYSSELLVLIDQYLDFIRETRSSKKIADSIIHKIMTYFSKYTPIQIEYAVRQHMSMEDKRSAQEEYTFGIIRKSSEEEAARRLPILREKGEKKGSQSKDPVSDEEFRKRLEALEREGN
ncbi:hypothetical protein QYF50_15420 [Paenibacillus vini]|uniref:hypothetical protein n=1 Tax=Paenibacillus vini TaxID=1476024 RepID=UPI0025B63313|nr:hypothetical protein [Paenibacillus vini]MDN4069241.1 hypothetical protein [Paenibacillus vini]MDN4069294.1 hypothetical protein [Paenibacillus vini]